jgi:putative oxidoreductase
MLRSTHRRIPLALLFLRLSVFLVMLMWTLDKFINPDHAAAVFETFYFIGGLSNILIYVIGVAQLVVIIGFVIGFKKRVTYLSVLFLHAVSTLSAFKQYLAPYEDANLLFFAAWPMLAACFALYYLHDWDTLWVIDKEKARLF